MNQFKENKVELRFSKREMNPPKIAAAITTNPTKPKTPGRFEWLPSEINLNKTEKLMEKNKEVKC